MKGFGITVLAMFALGGCAGRPTLVEPRLQEDFVVDDGMGVIVGSVSQEFTEGAEGAFAYFYLDDTEGERIDSLEVFSILSLTRKTEFEDASGNVGRVFAITLDPGAYQFGDWSIDNGTGMSIYPKKPEGLEFSIDRGEIIYVGNLHMDFETGRNVFGVMITSGGWPALVDQAERDIPIIEEKYPVLSGDIDKQVIDGHLWSLERLKERYNTTLENPEGEQ